MRNSSQKQFQMSDDMQARTGLAAVRNQVGAALARGVKRHKLDKILAGVGLSVASVQAFAVTTPPDFSTLTSGVDYSTVGPALLAIAVLISGVYVLWKGAKMILGAIRGA